METVHYLPNATLAGIRGRLDQVASLSEESCHYVCNREEFVRIQQFLNDNYSIEGQNWEYEDVGSTRIFTEIIWAGVRIRIVEPAFLGNYLIKPFSTNKQ